MAFVSNSASSNSRDGAPAPLPELLVGMLALIGVEGRGFCCVGECCCALVMACKASTSPYPLRES